MEDILKVIVKYYLDKKLYFLLVQDYVDYCQIAKIKSHTFFILQDDVDHRTHLPPAQHAKMCHRPV